jgi:hypothetical protein
MRNLAARTACAARSRTAAATICCHEAQRHAPAPQGAGRSIPRTRLSAPREWRRNGGGRPRVCSGRARESTARGRGPGDSLLRRAGIIIPSGWCGDQGVPPAGVVTRRPRGRSRGDPEIAQTRFPGWFAGATVQALPVSRRVLRRPTGREKVHPERCPILPAEGGSVEIRQGQFRLWQDETRLSS